MQEGDSPLNVIALSLLCEALETVPGPNLLQFLIVTFLFWIIMAS
jgi:hypothetical protein